MQEITFHVRGVSPLICHNARLSDPLDEWTMKVAEMTSKKKKTHADLIEIARREWFGSLYLGENGEPVIPGTNLERMLRDSAAKSKMGKVVQAGLICTEPDFPIIYTGPKDPEKMWEAGDKFALRASCKVGQQRVIRTRPCWRQWELKFDITFDETLLNPQAVSDFVELAGKVVGLGDWRPKHGRFELV